MAIVFQHVVSPPLNDLDATAPEGAVIGIAGRDGSGKSTLLRLATGVETPVSGSVRAGEPRRLIGLQDSLDFRPVAVLGLDHALARRDALVRRKAAMDLYGLCREGATVFLVSHEEDLLRDLADEVWWLDSGKLMSRGDPAEVLRAYGAYIGESHRKCEPPAIAINPRWRRGNGRATIEKLELTGESGHPTYVVRSGELAVVRLTLHFHDEVAEPVVGLMIRSRAGMNVYGTNTELEGLKLGPCRPGESIELSFAFRAELCNGEYTLTAASHDPDGVWHDWLEDAIAFAVADNRYTAGVANLRATASISRRG